MQYHKARELHIPGILNFCLYFINIRNCYVLKCLAMFLVVWKKWDKVSTVSATDTAKLFPLKDTLCMQMHFKD